MCLLRASELQCLTTSRDFLLSVCLSSKLQHRVVRCTISTLALLHDFGQKAGLSLGSPRRHQFKSLTPNTRQQRFKGKSENLMPRQRCSLPSLTLPGKRGFVCRAGNTVFVNSSSSRPSLSAAGLRPRHGRPSPWRSASRADRRQARLREKARGSTAPS